MTTPIKPITKIILQAADQYYSMVWDGTAGITIAPGAGIGSVIHNNVVYTLTAADQSGQSAPPPLASDADYHPDAL